MANSTKKSQARKGSKRTKSTKTKVSASQSTTQSVFRPSLAFLEHFGIKPEDFDAINAFMKLKDQDRVKASRKVIQDSIINASEPPDARFPLAVAESETLLKGYATLDDQHRAEIQKLISQITAYLRDATRKRPFNALMLAAPGAGKSHFIKQLANSMKGERVQAVDFQHGNNAICR